jgi:hypothetical protein
MIAMLMGGIIIAACQWFSDYAPVQELHFFNLSDQENRQWSVGRRELVHLVGFVGCVLFGWSFARSITIKLLRTIHICCAVIAAAGIYLAVKPFDAIGDTASGLLLASAIGMKVYCGW